MELISTHTHVHAHDQRTIDNWQHIFAIMKLCWRHAHTRRTLKQLDADQLADIGVSHTQAKAEARKPFWK